MYKNIVFDFGGVMVDFDPHKYLIDLFGNRGLEEEVYDLTFGSREWRLLDAGRITRREANERMLQRARAVGRGFEVEGVLDDWMSMLRPRRRMQTLVEQLKQRGYCVYYLSNIPEDVLDLLMHRDFEGLFDGGVASCEVKINKPDPRIYQALLDKYHLRADECIFIDDRAENLVAASALGFGIYEMHNVGTLLRSLPPFGVRLPSSRRFHTHSTPPMKTASNSKRPLPGKAVGQRSFCCAELTSSRSSGSSAGCPPAEKSRCSAPSP